MDGKACDSICKSKFMLYFSVKSSNSYGRIFYINEIDDKRLLILINCSTIISNYNISIKLCIIYIRICMYANVSV